MNARIFSRIARSGSSIGGCRCVASAGIDRIVLGCGRVGRLEPRSRSASAVELGGDDVQAPQHGHDVGDQVVLDDVREDLEVDERRRPGADPPGGLAAVGDEVIAELAVGALDRRVDLVARASRSRGWA